MAQVADRIAGIPSRIRRMAFRRIRRFSPTHSPGVKCLQPDPRRGEQRIDKIEVCWRLLTSIFYIATLSFVMLGATLWLTVFALMYREAEHIYRGLPLRKEPEAKAEKKNRGPWAFGFWLPVIFSVGCLCGFLVLLRDDIAFCAVVCAAFRIGRNDIAF